MSEEGEQSLKQQNTTVPIETAAEPAEPAAPIETVVEPAEPIETAAEPAAPIETAAEPAAPNQTAAEPAAPNQTAVATTESKSDSYILPFKAIHSFVTSVNEEFGTKNKPLRLYARLIEQTTFSHELPIRKHVQAFTNFCVANRAAIYGKSHDKLAQDKIVYSERVHINIREIFALADRDQRAVMWQHILTISALVDSTGKAKQILKDAKAGKNETNFLTNIIEKVEKNINLENASSNPFEAIGQLMSSGVFTEIIGSMNSQIGNGDLDMSKMMGAVQGMMSTMTKDQPEMGQMMDGLMKSMGNGENGLDLSSLMSSLGNLGGLGANAPTNPTTNPPSKKE